MQKSPVWAFLFLFTSIENPSVYTDYHIPCHNGSFKQVWLNFCLTVALGFLCECETVVPLLAVRSHKWPINKKMQSTNGSLCDHGLTLPASGNKNSNASNFFASAVISSGSSCYKKCDLLKFPIFEFLSHCVLVANFDESWWYLQTIWIQKIQIP